MSFKEKQVESMNIQSDLQAVFIALLTRHSSLVVGRPHRASFKTKQFIKIKEVNFDRFDQINMLQLIQKRSKEQENALSENEKTSRKTAKRRIQLTKRRETMRILQDILAEFGFLVFIEKETVDGYEGDITIYENGVLFMTMEQIRESGNIINEQITSMLSTTNNVPISKDMFCPTQNLTQG
ncbi:hypothetical protein EIN_093560 [Entamoeba invadens IP1]|uniref:Uncharacterized protein n=1 Tax=Entamoeba invadens IP1 TaxID=370355 RepID=A0A0A1TZZ4_ENTIV|nr:hypothetical protein EIN_093560 [Entamoeba invadens IP1]ELP87199.1 hypothetical protein EIN_093560 [Entamoeba invadens IP1]|eukprot:XP_004253970.1 hypothetical protein EIN_093560 [Entamoeba invadens IP1]